MMATQEQIAAARRLIEHLRDQHANDVRKLISLLEGGAMKGKAADRLLRDCQAWEAAYKGVFNRALALVESVQPDPAKPADPLRLWQPPLNLPGRAGS
ncbi:hypothetical protein ACGFI3_34460 [Nonomuraea wenchangensis]|uniref:hypothetical protein n=1 Tax=Nonomuraea wenchangensis TaxID=568860 RepID=UPI003720102B